MVSCLGVDAGTHEIVASELTPDDVGDVCELPELLDQIDADVASMTADGAYDGETAYDAVAERHPEAAVIIPPRITAVLNETTTTQRDGHLAAIAQHGRIGWQRSSGYNRRSLIELQCIDTRPSSAGVFTLGLCPINGPKQRSDATRSTG